MKSLKAKLVSGFTLIEMLLVMAIISVFIVMGINYSQQKAFNTRMDRTSLQMQQILNAALAFYVANGAWPADLNTLQTQGYLPNIQIVSPWGQGYSVTPVTLPASSIPIIFVFTTIKAGTSTTAAANSIAGTLPLAYATSDTTVPPTTVTPCAAAATTCTVVATANVPGQNLNNASAVNFGSIYHNGACVPVPQCPVDPKSGTTMTPEIMVVPVSVSGTFDTNSTNLYPISSFTAYATGPSASPPVCKTNPFSPSPGTCPATSGGPNLTGQFWRVCMQVISEKGLVNWISGGNNWGKDVTMLAITRCSISGEPSGSDFTVFGP